MAAREKSEIKTAIAEAAAYPMIRVREAGTGAYDMHTMGMLRRGRVVLYDVFCGQDQLRGGKYRRVVALLSTADAPLDAVDGMEVYWRLADQPGWPKEIANLAKTTQAAIEALFA